MKIEQEVRYKLDMVNEEIANILSNMRNGIVDCKDVYMIKSSERHILQWVLDYKYKEIN